jgi:hypothetical protein
MRSARIGRSGRGLIQRRHSHAGRIAWRPGAGEQLVPARRLWARPLVVVLLAALPLGGCGAMRVVDGAPYGAKSFDGRERAAIQIQFNDAGYWALVQATLPGGEQCSGTFALLGESRLWGFLPPPARDYVGHFDAGLPGPCSAWLGAAQGAELKLHLTYHAMVNRFRAGIERADTAERVAGDWLLPGVRPPEE